MHVRVNADMALDLVIVPDPPSTVIGIQIQQYHLTGFNPNPSRVHLAISLFGPLIFILFAWIFSTLKDFFSRKKNNLTLRARVGVTLTAMSISKLSLILSKRVRIFLEHM